MINFELKYKSALGTATTMYACAKEKNNKEVVQSLELIFPELKESEDERIRKEILNVFKQLDEGTTILGEKYDYNKWIAWLEKQGEQKITRPVWKYKKDHTPLLRDSFILNKYGCVAKSPSGALVSDVWVLDFDELSKLPKEEIERQNEHRHIDKVEPKFKVGNCIVEPKFKIGDWVVEISFPRCYYKIVEVCESRYKVIDTKNSQCSISFKDEANCKLWTIQDAKDGDVLMANAPFIFNGNLEGGIGCPGAHCGINTLGKFQIPKYPELWTGHTTTPATKEQRDLLFQKMEEAGYKWDAAEKKLVKLPL